MAKIEVGTRIWWSQPVAGAGRVVQSGRVKSTVGKMYLVEPTTKGGTIRLVGKRFANTGRVPKEHEGYDFVY